MTLLKNAARKIGLKYMAIEEEGKIGSSACDAPYLMETEGFGKGISEHTGYSVYGLPSLGREKLINVARFDSLFANEHNE